MGIVCNNSPYVFRTYIRDNRVKMSLLIKDIAEVLDQATEAAPSETDIRSLFEECYQRERKELNEWETLDGPDEAGSMYTCYADWIKSIGVFMFPEYGNDDSSCNAWVPEDWRDFLTITGNLERQLVTWLTGEPQGLNDAPHPLAYFLTMGNDFERPELFF